ncbi:MAG TPA: phospho-sugar mutase [Candidatus Mediterraneibacter pullistercoris]|nr:phospho-sugar mutase [Candidatus Mediterraneibacter pullistercoris]
MYQKEYERWMTADLEDPDLKPELSKIRDNDDEIKERFAVALKFGTAGLRGVLGAGTNRMNIYVVRQATQGLANWVKTQGGTQTVAISYDSRIKSDVFAKNAAGVLAANGIKVRIYDALMPVPALSFATRYYNCNAGIMVTASHNPAKYNGYKAYGPDGCQMTDDAAAIVYEEIQKTDILNGAKYMSFSQGVEEGLIRFVGDDCKNALYEAIESRQVRPGLCRSAGLKLVYSPLNGSGLVPVTQVLKDIGITDITIVPDQEYPNGYFTTCSYPNPEIFEALEQGLSLAKETGADLMLATDPDADRVGIAMKCPDGSYELVSGNEVGVLLLDYICAGRIEKGTMPDKPVAVKSIVSTPLADAVAEHYGVELRNVLTGFKWIGDQIAQLEADGETDRFIFGFEESYGYLAGPYVRDKDAVIGSMLICEMAAYYRSIGSSLKQRMEEIYAQYGRYLSKVDSFEFPGLSGMDKMAGIMQKLREQPLTEIAGYKVAQMTDYQKPEETGLPAANVLICRLENKETVIIRPSGTEPKIKIYYTTLGKDLAEAAKEKEKLSEALRPIMA